MTIEINGKTYEVSVHGTVGLIYMVERMTGEAFEFSNPNHWMSLVYVVLRTSNPKDDEISFEWMLCHLTSKIQSQLVSYISQRFAELEGESVEAGGGEKKNH